MSEKSNNDDRDKESNSSDNGTESGKKHWHIGKDGTPKPCHAVQGQCPLRGANDLPVPHFNSREAADHYLESKAGSESGGLRQLSKRSPSPSRVPMREEELKTVLDKLYSAGLGPEESNELKTRWNREYERWRDEYAEQFDLAGGIIMNEEIDPSVVRESAENGEFDPADLDAVVEYALDNPDSYIGNELAYQMEELGPDYYRYSDYARRSAMDVAHDLMMEGFVPAIGTTIADSWNDPEDSVVLSTENMPYTMEQTESGYWTKTVYAYDDDRLMQFSYLIGNGETDTNEYRDAQWTPVRNGDLPARSELMYGDAAPSESYSRSIPVLIKGRPGNMYVLDEPLTGAQKAEYQKNGWESYKHQLSYAPEIVHDAVFIPLGVGAELTDEELDDMAHPVD